MLCSAKLLPHGTVSTVGHPAPFDEGVRLMARIEFFCGDFPHIGTAEE